MTWQTSPEQPILHANGLYYNVYMQLKTWTNFFENVSILGYFINNQI